MPTGQAARRYAQTCSPGRPAVTRATRGQALASGTPSTRTQQHSHSLGRTQTQQDRKVLDQTQTPRNPYATQPHACSQTQTRRNAHSGTRTQQDAHLRTATRTQRHSYAGRHTQRCGRGRHSGWRLLYRRELAWCSNVPWAKSAHSQSRELRETPTHYPAQLDSFARYVPPPTHRCSFCVPTTPPINSRFWTTPRPKLDRLAIIDSKNILTIAHRIRRALAPNHTLDAGAGRDPSLNNPRGGAWQSTF